MPKNKNEALVWDVVGGGKTGTTCLSPSRHIICCCCSVSEGDLCVSPDWIFSDTQELMYFVLFPKCNISIPNLAHTQKYSNPGTQRIPAFLLRQRGDLKIDYLDQSMASYLDGTTTTITLKWKNDDDDDFHKDNILTTAESRKSRAGSWKTIKKFQNRRRSRRRRRRMSGRYNRTNYGLYSLLWPQMNFLSSARRPSSSIQPKCHESCCLDESSSLRRRRSDAENKLWVDGRKESDSSVFAADILCDDAMGQLKCAKEMILIFL